MVRGYKLALVFLFSALSVTLVSCNGLGGFETVKEAIAVDVPMVLKVTKETYMNGREFCAKFTNTGEPSSYELGKWVDVPVDYSVKSSKKIKIYAYTRKKFDASLPTMIFVDGGPGQNTHMSSDLLTSGMNEIYFDQRGVGCSAPETWEEYNDPTLYSSVNTAQDIEEIRKAFGVDQLSIYGLSYGTVPATMYAHYFEDNTRALVIEGVVGNVENLSRYGFQAEKYNLVLAGLNSKQREAFTAIVEGYDEAKRMVVFNAFEVARYNDGGYRGTRDIVLKKLIKDDGSLDEALFARVYKAMRDHKSIYSTPQFPGAVDENVLTRIYCKELDGFSKDKYMLKFDTQRGFFEDMNSFGSSWSERCSEQKITKSMQSKYRESKYSTMVPVYYFQGSHDSATYASGALNHWKTVPQGRSYFLLSLKGGHNPAISKLTSTDSNIAKSHERLFNEALHGNAIDRVLVKQINKSITETTNKEAQYFKFVTWELYTNNKVSSFSDIEKEFGGLRRF